MRSHVKFNVELNLMIQGSIMLTGLELFDGFGAKRGGLKRPGLGLFGLTYHAHWVRPKKK